MLNLGIVGLGQIATEKMMPAIESSSIARVAALSDVELDHLNHIADKYGIERRYQSFDSMLKDHDIDIIYVATPNYLHAEHTIKALDSGKHVLCEKPMAINAMQAANMVSAARRNERKLAIGYATRWHPLHLHARDLLQSGQMGQPLMVSSHFSFFMPPERLSDWRFDSKMSGGGPLLDIGVYHFDMIRHILGLEIIELRAFLGVSQGWPVSDTFVMAGVLHNRTPFVISSSYNFRDEGFEIVCSGGTVRVMGAYGQTPYGRMVIETANELREPILDLDELPDYWNYLKEIEHFCDCVFNNRQPTNSMFDGWNDMKIIDEIHTQNRQF